MPNEIAAANRHVSFDNDVRLNHAAALDRHLRADHGKRPDFHICADLRPGIDNCRRMNLQVALLCSEMFLAQSGCVEHLSFLKGEGRVRVNAAGLSANPSP